METMGSGDRGMDDKLKRIEKYLAPDKDRVKNDKGLAGGYVQTGNQPYDRLRRSLKRVFPGYPDVFDYTQQDSDSRDDD